MLYDKTFPPRPQSVPARPGTQGMANPQAMHTESMRQFTYYNKMQADDNYDEFDVAQLEKEIEVAIRCGTANPGQRNYQDSNIINVNTTGKPRTAAGGRRPQAGKKRRNIPRGVSVN